VGPGGTQRDEPVQGGPQAYGDRVRVGGRQQAGVDALGDHRLDRQHDGRAGALAGGNLAGQAGRPGHGEQHLVDVRAVGGELAVRPGRRAQPGARVGVPGYRLVEMICQLGEVPLVDREQQRRLVREVQVDAGRRDPHLARDRAQRQRLVTGAVVEQAVGGADQFLAQPVSRAARVADVSLPGTGW
jgi:hypothetical protein